MDCSSYVVVSLLIFFYFVPVLDTLLYNMADGLVVLFAHSAFGIGLCPVDCCFYMICSYCLILCCNINKRLCFSLKLSFLQPSPCFIASLIFTPSRKLPV